MGNILELPGSNVILCNGEVAHSGFFGIFLYELRADAATFVAASAQQQRFCCCVGVKKRQKWWIDTFLKLPLENDDSNQNNRQKRIISSRSRASSHV